MSEQGPLLTVREGHEGTFVNWLKELGLEDFLKRYPIPKLIEWGWLVPQYRYSFPPEEFEDDPEFVVWPPVQSNDPLDDLWRPEWAIKSVDEPLWFLHPLFRADNHAGKMLRENGTPWHKIRVPSSFTTKNGREITPYVDYFFHWQGYALLDVIRCSDVIGNQPILNTPKAEDEAQTVLRIVDRVKADRWDPREMLSAPRRWGGLHQSMTWLSHYRALENAHSFWQLRHPEEESLLRDGATQLAQHLGVTQDALECSIKQNLLSLASEWRRTKERKANWITPVWPHLQNDIYDAVEWLCLLTGHKLDHYLDLWSRPSHRQYDGTEEFGRSSAIRVLCGQDQFF